MNFDAVFARDVDFIDGDPGSPPRSNHFARTAVRCCCQSVRRTLGVIGGLRAGSRAGWR